jgi:FkbM family methyltransferase
MFLWEWMQQNSLPVLLYGMGNGAEKVLALCREYGVPVAGVFSSDDRARNVEFQGYPVLSMGEILQKFQEAVILLAFGVYQDEVLARLDALAQRYTVLVPDLPLLGGPVLDPAYLAAHEADIQAARALLADEQSRKVFDTMLEAKFTGSLPCHFLADTARREDLELLHLGPQEWYLDLGAYNGDTILEFLSLTGGQYAAISAWEPDAHNRKKLLEATASLPQVTVLPYASWDRETTLTFSGKGGRNCGLVPDLPGRYAHPHPTEARPVDQFSQPYTFVKMDVEGAERETLLGMQEALRRHHPKLLISAYHRTDDFITLPLLLQQICPGYQMFLRRNRCLPAWEIQLYASWKD